MTPNSKILTDRDQPNDRSEKNKGHGSRLNHLVVLNQPPSSNILANCHRIFQVPVKGGRDYITP